jgi:hypothetical protein
VADLENVEATVGERDCPPAARSRATMASSSSSPRITPIFRVQRQSSEVRFKVETSDLRLETES